MSNFPSPPTLTPSIPPLEGAATTHIDLMPKELWQSLWREPFPPKP